MKHILQSKEYLHDKRVVERYLNDGLLTLQQRSAFIEALPDTSSLVAPPRLDEDTDEEGGDDVESNRTDPSAAD